MFVIQTLTCSTRVVHVKNILSVIPSGYGMYGTTLYLCQESLQESVENEKKYAAGIVYWQQRSESHIYRHTSEVWINIATD